MPDLLDDYEGRYFAAFGRPAPSPAEIGRAFVATVVDEAIASGEPIPDDFDWWAGLPDGAVA